jgi:hypothetical protein
VYNHEPEGTVKNCRLSLHVLDEQSFEALARAWEKSESVVLEEAPEPAGNSINPETQHEMFKEPV